MRGHARLASSARCASAAISVTAKVLDLIPAGVQYYVTVDIDGFDPSDRRRHGTPSPGGFHSMGVIEILTGPRAARHVAASTRRGRACLCIRHGSQRSCGEVC